MKEIKTKPVAMWKIHKPCLCKVLHCCPNELIKRNNNEEINT